MSPLSGRTHHRGPRSWQLQSRHIREVGVDVGGCASAGLIVVIRALLAGSSSLGDPHSPMGQPVREGRIARPDVRRDDGDVTRRWPLHPAALAAGCCASLCQSPLPRCSHRRSVRTMWGSFSLVKVPFTRRSSMRTIPPSSAGETNSSSIMFVLSRRVKMFVRRWPLHERSNEHRMPPRSCSSVCCASVNGV